LNRDGIAAQPLSWRRCRALIASDLWRHVGKRGAGAFWTRFLVTPGFRYTVLLRCYAYSRMHLWSRYGVRHLLVLALHRYAIRFGIDISRDVRIGSGFYLGHYGGIFVDGQVTIGDNCNLSHDVTLGRVNVGEMAGCPSIGNNVFIGPGAKIIGRIRIGDNVLIGANSVVVQDVAAGVTVGGVPARVISRAGSEGYINRTDYPPVPPA
jgi:serine O-acetyltransferase